MRSCFLHASAILFSSVLVHLCVVNSTVNEWSDSLVVCATSCEVTQRGKFCKHTRMPCKHFFAWVRAKLRGFAPVSCVYCKPAFKIKTGGSRPRLAAARCLSLGSHWRGRRPARSALLGSTSSPVQKKKLMPIFLPNEQAPTPPPPQKKTNIVRLKKNVDNWRRPLTGFYGIVLVHVCIYFKVVAHVI